MNSDRQILVYSDTGVDSHSLWFLVRSLRELGYCKIRCVHRYSLLHSLACADVLIFPGGRDIPYTEALAGEGNRAIRRWVEEGGRYLGFCAGAYYGCRHVAFEVGGPLEVVGERELAFFPGSAVGPAYHARGFSYTSQQGACVAQVITDKLERLSVYFNGGCAFHPNAQMQGVAVIGRYEDLCDQPAAIVSCVVGKGKALLSGVHLEYGVCDLPKNNPYTQTMIPLLKKGDEKRRALFQSLFSV